jgi:NADH:ubiquinone oxidoreductase subunit 5 (subunit L)/multisubunit Na+/H+ antiporter MnhA subunit
MAPTIVVGIIDNRRERYKTICIGSLNIIGILPSALKMFDQDHSFERAFALLADSSTWLVILSATAAGIGIAIVGPAIISMFYVARLEKKSRQLKDYQKKLRDEWGDEVSEKVR